MPDSPAKFYLTTPIYYVNARPHIGHAYTTIVADVLARRSRAQGTETWFLTGTDEHGQKIERSAHAAAIPPQTFTDAVSAEFKQLWDRMGLTYDQYIRTTDPAHKRGVQKLWQELQSRGHIYLSSYTGQYCVSEEIFVEGPPGTLGPDGRPTETVTEENYFFRLSAFQRPLIDLLESDTLEVRPESRKNELLSFLRGPVHQLEPDPTGAPPLGGSLIAEQGAVSSDARPSSSDPEQNPGPTDIPSTTTREPSLTASAPTTPTLAFSTQGNPYIPGNLRDLSISRSSFTWGIPVPGNPKHVIYVWLDALANYLTAVGYGDDSPAAQAKLAKFWPADLHLVGKEIIRQHCIYWPAFLLAAGLPLPKKVTAHGWLLFNDSKMSKSVGNIVRTETILDAFGTLCPTPPSPSQPATQSLRAPFISQPHREMSGNLAAHPTPSFLSSRSEAEEPAVALGMRRGLQPPVNDTQGEGASAPSSPTPATLPTPHQRDLFAADVLRYFLLREIPFGQDGSFSFEALITRYNADLVNGYGNLVSRTLTLANTHFHPETQLPTKPWLCEEWQPDPSDTKSTSVNEALSGTATLIRNIGILADVDFNFYAQQNQFHLAITYLSNGISSVDGYLSFHKPWKLAKSAEESDRKKLVEVLYTAAESIRIITALLHPILPYATAAVWRQLGLGEIEQAAKNGDLKNLTWGGLQPGTKLGPLAPIFPRADKGLAQIMADMETEKTSLTGQRHEAPAPETLDPTSPAAPPRTASLAEPNPGAQVAASTAHTTERPGTPPHTEAPASGIFAGQPTDSSPQITIDDFAKIELRVAQILVCERIPKADKLLRLEVDLGYERRQILSGIAEWYTPEDLIGRRIVVITNLAPRKMRGLESHGMLLAASTDGGKPHLATFTGPDSDALPLGSRLK